MICLTNTYIGGNQIFEKRKRLKVPGGDKWAFGTEKMSSVIGSNVKIVDDEWTLLFIPLNLYLYLQKK